MRDPASLIGGMCEGRRVPAVTIFGWDDVLCPTTHAKQHNKTGEVHGKRRDVRASKLERKELLRLGQSVVRLVKAARRHGPVVVVTNSRERWVRGTAELLLPGGAAAACLEKVEVVSSSDRFGKDFPNQPACWQIAALSYVTNRYLLSAGALARVRLADAAAAVAAVPGAQEIRGRAGESGGCGRVQEAGRDLVRGEAGASHQRGEDSGSGQQLQRGGIRRSILRRSRNFGRSSTGSGDDHGGLDGGTRGAGPRGTLIAVATASRSSENKSATLTLREHHPDVVAKTVSLMEAPTPSELRNQLDLLADNFERMLGHCLVPQGAQSPAPVPPAPALAPAPPAQAPVPPAPAPLPETSATPPAPAPAPRVSPAPAPVPPAPPVSPVMLTVPTMELPLKLRRSEEAGKGELRYLRVQRGPPPSSSFGGGGAGDCQKIDDRGDSDDGDGYRTRDGGRGLCGSFWSSASSRTPSSASTTARAPLADATSVNLPSNGTAAVASIFDLPAVVAAVPGGGAPPKNQKSRKQHLSPWSNDGGGGGGGGGGGDGGDEDEEEYLTAVCSESTMSSNVSSLTGEVGVGGGLPFTVEGPELLSPPLGWASATSAPPNPPPRLHRRCSKPPVVAVE